MSNSVQYLLYALLLVICLATGYWFYNNFEWVTEEQDVGFQGIAKTNQLLAAEIFLRRMGVQAKQVNGLIAVRQLPPTQHTMMITTQRETLTDELSQRLLDWVRAGGHLIVEARYLSSNELKKASSKEPGEYDPLLDEFFVYTTRNDSIDKKDDRAAIFVLPRDESEAEITVHFPHYRKLVTATDQKIHNTQYEKPEPSWVIKDELGQYLAQYSLDSGLLTVLNSSNIFKNNNLDENDNAYLLHYLVQQPGYDGGVWLIRVDDMPALWRWLWDNAWYAMTSLTLLFLLWLWRAPLRFGPVMDDEKIERRSLLEHVRASAYYRWHEEQKGVLLSKVQESLWEKIHVTHPIVRRENPAQAFAMLAEITSIKESLIKQALSPVQEMNEHEFTRLIRILENIRKHL